MTEKEIDIMWNKALYEAVSANEPYTRYKFAAHVEARVRETCALQVEKAGMAGLGTLAAAAIIRKGEDV